MRSDFGLVNPYMFSAPALAPCPWCGCEMRMERKDSYAVVFVGEHGEKCPFSMFEGLTGKSIWTAVETRYNPTTKTFGWEEPNAWDIAASAWNTRIGGGE